MWLWFAAVLSAVGLNDASPAFAEDLSVALIGDDAIRMTELESRTADRLRTQETAYQEQLHALEVNQKRERYSYMEHELSSMIDERVLELEAKSEGTTSAALISAIKVPTVSEEQAKAFYDAQGGPQLGKSYEELAPKIREYLERQANDGAKRRYLQSLRLKYKAVATLEPLREEVAASGPGRGPPQAPIVLVEYSDFQCPYCGRFEGVLKTTLARYPGMIRLVYENYPLTDIHPDAEKAAEAAECAEQQGKFWELHDRMFAEQASLGVDALKDKARSIGLDSRAFDQCLDSGSARDSVQRDVQAARRLAVVSTPTSFVNGRLVLGAVSAEDLAAVIDDELRRHGR